MPRPKGTTNPDYDHKRQNLLQLLRDALLAPDPPSSFRDLATAAAVTIPTLRHYFGNREAVFDAIFEDFHHGALNELAITAKPSGSFPHSMEQLCDHLSSAFEKYGLTALHAVALMEGMRHPEIAASYLNHILEPTLAAIELRLSLHIDSREMRKTNPRHAALAFLSPILVVFLHQHSLKGQIDYPLTLKTSLQDHVRAFLRAYQI